MATSKLISLGKLISLVVLLAATGAWGREMPTREALFGEVLQQQITVEPGRIAHHLEGPARWVVSAPPRPLVVPFPEAAPLTLPEVPAAPPK